MRLLATATRPSRRGPPTHKAEGTIRLLSPEWMGPGDTLTITMPETLDAFGAVVDGVSAGRVLVTGLTVEAIEERG